MTDDIEFLKSENAKLHGEVFAVEVLLTSLIAGLLSTGVVPRITVENVFEGTEEFLTASAMRWGQRASPDQTTQALRVIEDLRKGILSDG